ncbi:putative cell surface protein [Paenibacillus sp. 598K]|uniref:YncE family protein n=1 Tax=Paenibacillus sp. 598K TaxID=1117987 RepID=UPI000FF9E644|nr:hypothetical protein [Paenibacillus sp. 598K]GBF75359.1 putative cell surface protein [Paenibacillus sp. 598K]
MITNKANRSRNLPNGLPFVYASYVNNRNVGQVAVIDPDGDEIIQRLTGFFSPSAMCTDPSEQKLYVTDDYLNRVNIFRLDDFRPLGSVTVGTNPVAVFVEPSGKKAYVASYGDYSVTIINAVTNGWIKKLSMPSLQPGVLGRPFAFISNEKSPFVYVACKRDNGEDYLAYIGIEDDTVYRLDFELPLAFDETRNPLVIRPDGSTLVSLAEVGIAYFVGHAPYNFNSTSLLDNTVSGVYLDNNMLFCTTRENKDYLKVFVNLKIDEDRNITYGNFIELSSYKGQDVIRTSRSQTYVGVTVQPTLLPTGGLQVIDVKSLQYEFVALDVVGDMTFFSDEKAYVAEINSVLSIDLATMLPQNRIQIGGNDITVRNVISGYSNQSS